MGRATRRNSNGRQGATGGLQGRELRGHFRWRLHELPLPVAQRTVPPASAANVAVSSSASSFRPRPVVLAVGGRSLARLSDPLFHWKSSSPPFSRISLSLPLFLPFVPQKPCSLSGVGPRCSETSYNGVTWPLLSRAPVLRSYPIAYTSPLAEFHPRRRSLPLSAPRARVALCIPPRPDKWRARRTVRTGLSCTSIIQVGVRDAPGAQEVSRLGAQVTRSLTGVNCRR